MKFVAHRDFELVTSALNFTTPDLHVLGGCDLYTTKAAGGDKKLYKNIESGLEAQHRADQQFSNSLSPPQKDALASSLNLSRSSPFGNLGHISSRRTYAYMIATLNASHPDYDFSAVLQPSDFKREKSLRAVMNNIDSVMSNLRPRPLGSFLSLPNISPGSACPPNSQPPWGPGMWRLIDQQMSLRDCSVYRYAPEEFDPFEDDEDGSLWSINYFFFNRLKKRVCYLYLRGVSVLAHQGGTETPLRTPISNSQQLDEDSDGWQSPLDAGATKRARYWFGSRDGVQIRNDDTDQTDQNNGYDAMDFSMSCSPPKRPVVDENDHYLLSDEEVRSARSHSTLRAMSEEIVGPIEV